MEKLVTFSPAWDKTDKDPMKNFGIHGVELRMVLKGTLGATQFVLYTGWMIPGLNDHEPMAADIGYHAPTQQFEGQISTDDCPYLDGKPCFYDGSGLRAMRVFDVLRKEGSDGVWKLLEEEYVSRFGNLE